MRNRIALGSNLIRVSRLDLLPLWTWARDEKLILFGNQHRFGITPVQIANKFDDVHRCRPENNPSQNDQGISPLGHIVVCS